MATKINEAFAGDKVKIKTGDAAEQEGYVTGTHDTKVTVLLSNHKSVEVESDAVEVVEEIDYAERLPVRLPMFESFKAANIRKANKTTK